MLKLCVLGPFSLSLDDRAVAPPSLEKARTLLAYLALHGDGEQTRDQLVDLLWPDAEPGRARANLNTALWNLRRCFRDAGLPDDSVVLATKNGVRLVAPIDFDVARFTALVNGADPARQQDALALYRGDFLEGCYDDWCAAERERLAGVFESLLADIVKRSGDVAVAQRLVARNPYGEDAYAVLIEAELKAGRPFAAAALADRCRAALDEVGAKPSAEFASRFAALSKSQLPEHDVAFQLPFVGRERELAILSRIFDQIKDGQGRVVVVHGEAGIGKSVLLARSGRLARDRDLSLVRMDAADTGEIYGPWSELFRALVKQELDEFVRGIAGDAAQAVAARIAAALPVPSVVVVDDAHELRGDALGVLARFVELCSPSNGIILSTRPEGVRALRSLVADFRPQEIELVAIARNEWASALAQATGDSQSELLDVLFDRTAGHPMYFATLVRSLLDSGGLTLAGGRWIFSGRSDKALELPLTLRTFIETRLRARGDNPAAVACALALEPSASAEEISAALGLDDERALDAIDDLIALGLVGQPSSGPYFALSHDLITEVAASLLNAGRRTRLHRNFASILERRPIAGTAIRRALHLAKAQSFLAAAEAYADAALEALRSRAFVEALERCRAGFEALDALGDEPAVRATRAGMRQLEALALAGSGDAAAAVAAATTAVNEARTALAPGGLAERVLLRAEALVMTQEAEPLARDAAELSELAATIGDDELRIRALRLSAEAARLAGSAFEALELAQAAFDEASRAGKPDLMAAAADTLARTQITWWRFGDASSTIATGLMAAARLGAYSECSLIITRAMLFYAIGRPADVRSDLTRAAEIASRTQVHELGSDGSGVGWSWNWLYFWMDYLDGLVAEDEGRIIPRTRARFEAKHAAVMRVRAVQEAVTLLEVDALLASNADRDAEMAAQLADALADRSAAQTLLGWSDLPVLAKARVAARLNNADAPRLLRLALDELEERGRATPLLVDQAFERLATAAREAGTKSIETRAFGRGLVYRRERMAAVSRRATGLKALR